MGLMAFAGSGQVKILFDATKAETVANADWQIDADQFNLQFINGLPVVTNQVKEANPQRYPTPPSTMVDADTPETFWTGALSAWAVESVRYGYEVETLPVGARISYGDNSNDQDLKNYKIFVLCEPNILFTAQESQAIKDFVSDGGGLFMVCNHLGSDRNNDGVDSPVIFNNLMGPDRPFGFVFDSLSLWTYSNNGVSDPDDPIIRGPFGLVDSIKLSAGTSMKLFPEINPDVKGKFYLNGVSQENTGAIAVASKYGLGKVFAIGDSSIPDDGTGDVNDNLYNGWSGDVNGSHARLVMNATVWLATNDLPALTLSGTIKDVSCFGVADGSIVLQATGGDENYVYKWSNGANSAIAENIPAGKYFVTVTSAGYSVLDSFQVNQPDELSVVTATIPISCANDGIITATVTGGVPPYNYQWSSGQSEKTMQTSIPGTYTLLVADNKNCQKETTVQLEGSLAPPKVSIIGDTILDCQVKTLMLQAESDTGEVTYNWTGNGIVSTESTLTINQAGTYLLTAMSAVNGCVTTITRTIISDTIAPNLDVIQIDTLTCNTPAFTGTAITVADLVAWSYEGNLISNESTAVITQPGQYMITGTNSSNHCQTTLFINVAEDKIMPVVVLDTVVHDIDNMGSGSILLSLVSGQEPVTFSWQNTEGNILAMTPALSNIFTGTYTCIITSANGCKSIVEVNVENISGSAETKTNIETFFFPNPADDYLEVKQPKDDEAELYIFNGLGQTVLHTVSKPGRKDISKLPQGVYVVMLRQKNLVIAGRLIVTRIN